ncbi:hypothetical protein [Staphylococcus agnetis]|uniref:hypothetical protein n=1 Tax=Staphylococcus agnetis TaxID=985762 RepID=UPI0004E2BCEC|nr:hypothetical protein [Staphylococcus agnetis]KFE41034.1 hypothetical protein SAGN_09572 [Staphylococcus agnetis]NJH65153.1 hypothetical protein [Staphylococcus agnetis]NJH97047.1 hypothetical protein [Staphylococcus agnetis]PTH46953.1 hypothetical protein BU587_08040 [Staphylococcus agnetis]PTH73522.1 hypothetical protein BU580_07560 [Staphylococcus agnetis]
MNNNFLHIEAFEKERANPKILMKCLLFVLLACFTAVLSILLTDYTSLIKELDIPASDAESMLILFKTSGIIASFIIYILFLVMYFVIALITAKVAHLDVKANSIFSASLLMLNIISLIHIVILSLQWVFGLQLPDINIGSLNILSPGNSILGAISIQNIVSSWLFGVLLYSTCHLSKKWAWVAVIIHMIVCVLLSILFV